MNKNNTVVVGSKVLVLDPDFEGEIGCVIGIDNNEGDPVAKVKYGNLPHQNCHCFFNELEVIE